MDLDKLEATAKLGLMGTYSAQFVELIALIRKQEAALNATASSVATVDTPDIVKLMSFWEDAEPGQEALEKYQAVIAHIDAHVAKAVAAATSAPQPTQAALSDEFSAALNALLNHVIDDFREMNPSNYTHDDACDLNNWGVEASGLAQAVQDLLAASQQPSAAPVQAAVVPDGYVLVPNYRGYAHLGTGNYILNHSCAGDPAEFVASIATEAEKAGRAVGDLQPNAPDALLQPDAMAVRIRFENVAGLDALEQQLRLLRAEHFPESAAPSPAPVQPADAAPSQAHAMPEYTVSHSELARKIITFFGRATSDSLEPSADPFADRLAEKLCAWIGDIQPPQAQQVAEAVQANPHAATYPSEIWLQAGECSAEEASSYKSDAEITWCWESIDDMDVRYIRADLATQPTAQAAPVEAVPYGYLIVNADGHIEFATKRRNEAQEHINDACEQGDVEGAEKWRAVPVHLHRPSDDEMWDQTLRERDYYHDVADRLAGAIAEYFDADIGEHSSANCPWNEALRVIEEAAPFTPAQAAPASQVRDDAPIKDAIRTAYMQGYDDGKEDGKAGAGCSRYNPTRIDWKLTQQVVAALAHKPASGEA